MSSLAERKKALTLALLALSVAAIASAMLTPHVAFAGGDDHDHHDHNDDNNCDDNNDDDNNNCNCDNNDDDNDDNNCDEDP
jgi:hypothetical protein